MGSHIDFIASVITEDPDVILAEYDVISEATEKGISKFLDKLAPRLGYDISNIKNKIVDLAVNQHGFNELGVSKWVAKIIANDPELLRHPEWQQISDFLKHQQLNGVDFDQKKSFGDYLELSDEWHKSLSGQKRGVGSGGEPVMHQFPDGYKIVELQKNEHCDAEGQAMGHCAKHSLYDPETVILYSLRDRRNEPHVTIELTHENKINQVKGKENKAPIAKYAKYVLPWLDRQFSFPTDYTYSGINDYISSVYDKEYIKKILNGHSNWSSIDAIVRNNNIDAEMVLRYGDKNVIKQYAETTPDKNDMLVFAKSNKASVRAFVASNRRLPESIISMLVKDNRSLVRTALAKRTKNEEALMTLASDPSDKVKEAVTRNSFVTPEILIVLMEDPDMEEAMSYNVRMPLEIFGLLVGSNDEDVRANVARRIKSISDSAYTSAYTPEKKDEIETTLRHYGHILAQDKNADVRAALASTESINPKVLPSIDKSDILSLATDPKKSVRMALARNESLTKEYAMILVKDQDIEIARTAERTLLDIEQENEDLPETEEEIRNRTEKELAKKRKNVRKLRAARKQRRLERTGWID